MPKSARWRVSTVVLSVLGLSSLPGVRVQKAAAVGFCGMYTCEGTTGYPYCSGGFYCTTVDLLGTCTHGPCKNYSLCEVLRCKNVTVHGLNTCGCDPNEVEDSRCDGQQDGWCVDSN